MDNRVILLAMVAIAGVYLLGTGISGMVVSQSCCFGEDCPPEYLCDAAEPIVQSPAPVKATLSGVVGIMLLGAAAAAYVHHQRSEDGVRKL
jgi:hypothetical protein